MAYNPAEQVEKNQQFFSDAAIAARADAVAARRAKLEGTFAEKQAGLEKIHGTEAQREAAARDIHGTFGENADLKRQLEGTFEQKQAGLEKIHGTEEQRETGLNRRADLQYGPNSIAAQESKWRYGPEGLGERELDVHNRNVDASVYATESANARHLIPQAQYSYHTEEGPGGEKSTGVFLNGKRVNPSGEADYSWLKDLKHTNEQHLTQISDLALVQPPEDKKAFYDALGKQNPQMLKALNAYQQNLGIGTATQTAKSNQQLREEATARLQAQGIEIPTSKPAASTSAFPAPPYRSLTVPTAAEESPPASQPVRSYPGTTQVTSAPRKVAGPAPAPSVATEPTREGIRVMTPDELTAQQALFKTPPAAAPAPTVPAADSTAGVSGTALSDKSIPIKLVKYFEPGKGPPDPSFMGEPADRQYLPLPKESGWYDSSGMGSTRPAPVQDPDSGAAKSNYLSTAPAATVASPARPSAGERIASDFAQRYGSPNNRLIDFGGSAAPPPPVASPSAPPRVLAPVEPAPSVGEQIAGDMSQRYSSPQPPPIDFGTGNSTPAGQTSLSPPSRKQRLLPYRRFSLAQ